MLVVEHAFMLRKENFTCQNTSQAKGKERAARTLQTLSRKAWRERLRQDSGTYKPEPTIPDFTEKSNKKSDQKKTLATM